VNKLTNYKSRFKNFFKKKSTKDISWMVGANILIKPLQVAKSFIVAKYLGPEDYGIIKSVELIQMLNKFGDLGFNSTVIRDVGVKIGEKSEEEIQEIKNNAYSSELVLTFVLFLAGLISNFFFQSPIIRYAIILSSIGLFTLKIQNLFNTEATINKRFKLISKLVVIQAIINSVLIIATVSFIKIYAVLVFPIFSTLIIIFLYYKKINIPFRFKFNKSRLQSILSTSFKLTSGALAFGVFRYTERIIVISLIGLQAVGYFGFADTILGLFVVIFLTNIKVRKMDLLEDLGKGAFKKVHQIVVRETATLTVISFIVVGCSMVGLSIFVPMFLEKWVNGILVAQLFLLVLPMKVLNSYFFTVIKSPIVDKLLYTPALHITGSLVLIIGAYSLDYYDLLTLLNFIYLDIFAYGIVHISGLFIYYKEFYKPYVKNQKI
tara:strand:- start:20746 stop:22047 length:1302 start_codon:yes stop_codon:yes gene_type:complete